MTSTAPTKTGKTAAAAMTRRGAYAALAESLAQEVVDAADPSPEHASNTLLALGREWARRGGGDAGVDMPSMIELLEVTGIGRALARASGPASNTAACPMRGKSGKRPRNQKSGGGMMASPP